MPSINPGVVNHVIGLDNLHTALHGLLTVVHVSLDGSEGLHEILQWVKTHSQY